MFDDDWESSRFLFPRDSDVRPPVTLLVVAVGDNIIFDPAKEELAVAETALAVSVSEVRGKPASGGMDVDSDSSSRQLRLLSIRTVDPPSRLTPPGVPHVTNTGVSEVAAQVKQQQQSAGGSAAQGVWKAPLGGTKFGVLDAIIQAVMEKGGVADEVLDGLDAVELA